MWPYRATRWRLLHFAKDGTGLKNIASKRFLLPEGDALVFLVVRAGRGVDRAADGSLALVEVIFAATTDSVLPVGVVVAARNSLSQVLQRLAVLIRPCNSNTETAAWYQTECDVVLSNSLPDENACQTRCAVIRHRSA